MLYVLRCHSEYHPSTLNKNGLDRLGRMKLILALLLESQYDHFESIDEHWLLKIENLSDFISERQDKTENL